MKKYIKRIWEFIFGSPENEKSWYVYEVNETPVFRGESKFSVEVYFSFHTGRTNGRFERFSQTVSLNSREDCLEWIEWHKSKTDTVIEEIK